MGIDTPAGHLRMPFRIKPGCVIVFEGLDGTGKTTQHERIERACLGMGHGTTPLFEPVPLFLHMPSAGTGFGQAVYEMTENLDEGLDPLARQFLHLACHAQSVEQLIIPALDIGRPVFLDRWWWSTYAYGWAGNKSVQRRFGSERFINMCKRTWRHVEPDIIFLFTHPHVEDKHNTSRVLQGYKNLYAEAENVVLIDQGHEGEQNEQIFSAMLKYNLYQSG